MRSVSLVAAVSTVLLAPIGNWHPRQRSLTVERIGDPLYNKLPDQTHSVVRDEHFAVYSQGSFPLDCKSNSSGGSGGQG